MLTANSGVTGCMSASASLVHPLNLRGIFYYSVVSNLFFMAEHCAALDNPVAYKISGVDSTAVPLKKKQKQEYRNSQSNSDK